MTSSPFRSVMAFILLLLCSGSVRAAGQLLLDALATLPPKYLADVPEKDRDALIRSITGNPEHFHREGGWAHWFSDGRRIPATSMFWLKELPEGADARLLFVHMSKPFADGRLPSNDQTFVLRKTHDTWVDVTREVIPSGVDLTLHFRPM